MKVIQKEEVEPQCDCIIAHRKNKNYWELAKVTEKLLTWYEPCKNCFPEGIIDVDEVVKKHHRRSSSPKLHLQDV